MADAFDLVNTVPGTQGLLGTVCWLLKAPYGTQLLFFLGHQ
jgi:hypothetical protein